MPYSKLDFFRILYAKGRKVSIEKKASWKPLWWFGGVVYGGVTLPIPTTSFYVYIIVWRCYETNGYW